MFYNLVEETRGDTRPFNDPPSLEDPLQIYLRLRSIGSYPRSHLSHPGNIQFDFDSPSAEILRQAIQDVSTPFYVHHVVASEYDQPLKHSKLGADPDKWLTLFAPLDLTEAQVEQVRCDLRDGKLPIELLCKIAEPAPFGRGSERVQDPDIRQARQISASVLEAAFGAIGFDAKRFTDTLGRPGAKYRAQLYKLHIYEEGGKFDVHRDTLHGEDHVMTAIVAIPNPHKGGALRIHHQGNTANIDFSENWSKDQCAVFFTDCRHEIAPVVSGERVVLQFDIYQEQPPPELRKGLERQHDVCTEAMHSVPSPFPCESSKGSPTALRDAVVMYMQEKPVAEDEALAIALRHQYSLLALDQQILKGADRILFDALASLEYSLTLRGLIWSLDPDCGGPYYEYKDVKIEASFVHLQDVGSISKEEVFNGKVWFVPDAKCRSGLVELIDQEGIVLGNEPAHLPEYHSYMFSCLVISKKTPRKPALSSNAPDVAQVYKSFSDRSRMADVNNPGGRIDILDEEGWQLQTALEVFSGRPATARPLNDEPYLSIYRFCWNLNRRTASLSLDYKPPKEDIENLVRTVTNYREEHPGMGLAILTRGSYSFDLMDKLRLTDQIRCNHPSGLSGPVLPV